MKTCTKCKQKKEMSEFHKDRTKKGGYRFECRTCRNKYHQSKQGKDAHKRYRQSEKGKITRRIVVKRFSIRHPERFKAKDAVKYAIKTGKLLCLDALLCLCGNQAEQYHHHKGYAPEYWLNVIPICKKCHRKIHRKIAI